MKYAIFLAVIFAVLSVITYCLYAVDKKRAVKKKRRIPEKTLITFSLLGGATGGYLAMHFKRHKTKHWYFHLFHIIGLIWQASAIILCLIFT